MESRKMGRGTRWSPEEIARAFELSQLSDYRIPRGERDNRTRVSPDKIAQTLNGEFYDGNPTRTGSQVEAMLCAKRAYR
jgi:hypothetical protein